MSDKNLFQITYDVIGYSPGGYTIDNILYLPIKNKEAIQEINHRYKKLIDDYNTEEEKKKNPKLLPLHYVESGDPLNYYKDIYND